MKGKRWVQAQNVQRHTHNRRNSCVAKKAFVMPGLTRHLSGKVSFRESYLARQNGATGSSGQYSMGKVPIIKRDLARWGEGPCQSERAKRHRQDCEALSWVLSRAGENWQYGPSMEIESPNSRKE